MTVTSYSSSYTEDGAQDLGTKGEELYDGDVI